MRTRQLNLHQLQTRNSDDGTMTIEGQAVPYGHPIDYAGLREDFGAEAFNADDVVGVPLLWSHDRAEPVGHITAAHNSDEGLQIEAVIQPTARGRDAQVLLAGESMRGLSVGFTPDEVKDNPHGVTYTRATLHELSLTPLPAYGEKSTVTATREREEPPMSESTETREAPEVDLAPITERIDQLEARMLAKTEQPAPRIGAVEGFTRQLLAARDAGGTRALADVLSSGNSGVLPPTWSSEVRDYVDTQRYLFSAAGSLGFPSSGHTLTVPKVTQNTTVAARGAEKSEVPSQAFTTSQDVYTAAWYAGGVDIALEVIWQSDPAILSLVVQDILGQYAVATDTAYTTAAEAAATATGAALDLTDYGTFIADVIGNAETIRAATGQFGDYLALTTASWQTLLGFMDADGRRILATGGATNSDGTAGVLSRAVNVGGVMAFHSPRSSVDLQFNTKSLRKAEKPPMSLSIDNVALMGRDIGVLGAIITLPLYPAGIRKYAV